MGMDDGPMELDWIPDGTKEELMELTEAVGLRLGI